MENNTINNHICNNTVRHYERGLQKRSDRTTIEQILNGGCSQNDYSVNESNNNICDRCEIRRKNEHGGEVFVTNVGKMACRNNNYRESIWTGNHLQTTLMSIQRGKDIGIEMHNDTDQYIRVEYGMAMVLTGNNEYCMDNKYRLSIGDAIYIPAGTWHNVVNAGRCTLKLSSVYAPPHHPRCTVEKYRK